MSRRKDKRLLGAATKGIASHLGKLRVGVVSVVMLCGTHSQAWAFEWLFGESTSVVNLRETMPLAETTHFLSSGGYQLSDDTTTERRKWRETKNIKFYAEFRTEIAENLGVLWGFSTGESGAQYSIDPAMSLGLHMEQRLSERSDFSIFARTWLGGNMQEKTCAMNSDGLGGKIACRLVPSDLPANAIQNNLVEAQPERLNVLIQYNVRF